MPTDETTLEALAEKYEGLEDEYLKYRGMARIAFDHVDAERMDRNAAEARLIADALRFRLAALTAPAAQEGDPESDEAFFARIDARRKARQAQTFAEENQ